MAPLIFSFFLSLALSFLCSLTSKNGSSEAVNGNTKAQKINEDLQDFDDKLRAHRPAHDKALVSRSYFVSTLRVSWNLIEAEILHNPGTIFVIIPPTLPLHSGMFPEVLFRCENVGRQQDFANI